MRKRIISIVLIFLALASVPVVLFSLAFALPVQYDRSFYGGMKIKYDRLYGIEEDKVVVIGGSAMAFGIRSDLMEEDLGRPVVNYGLYANLGTKYMLDTARDAIQEGDIVIIAPEQNSQSLSEYFNGEAVWYTADGNFGILNKVSSEDRASLWSGFLPFVSGKFGAYSAGVKPMPDGVYNVDSFNEYGDIAYSDREHNVMSMGYDPATPISFSREVISEDFIGYLNDYAADLRSRGATVYYCFSPMDRLGLENGTGRENIEDYYNYLREKLKFEILGSPESRILDSVWFYDSNFHLNASGAVLYTRQLSLDLKAAAGDYSPTKIPLPEAPVTEPEGGEGGSGTSEEFEKVAKVFELTLHTAYDGRRVWRIDGLTEEGKTLKEFTIPDLILGIPVAEIADGAFAGDTAVKKITFGLNVANVGLGAFDGCSSLEGIYITSLDPNSYHPAKDVLSGADKCVFYIPEDVFAGKYLPDYFWGGLDRSILKSY